MMDNKTWIWRKKSSEKTIIPPENSSRSMKGLEEETEKLSKGTKGGPFLPARNLNEKLASVLLDCHAKDDLATIHEEWEQEYAADWEMENAEAVCLKKKLDEALKQGAAANEKLVQTEAALKQCIKQLSLFQQASEQTMDDAVTMPSSECKKAFEVLEDKLKETSKRLANVVVENTNLSKALLFKEKLVEELHKHVSQKSAESNILMAKLESKDKENAFFKYKFHMLEKELEVRNEELEYNRRSIDALHMQHLESVQKISKLESECQRLRGQTKKRLHGPSALTKMRNQVDGSGWNGRKSNPVRDLMLRDTSMEKPPVLQLEDKNIFNFIEKMSILEEETKVLKKLLTKKNAELQSSRMMFSRTASRLSQVEAQLIEHTGSRKLFELAHCSQVSNQLSPMAMLDLGSDDGISSSGSWANALFTELDHFREEKLKSSLSHGATEMSLMDDFVEVEKLAMVSAQAPFLGGEQTLSSEKELILVVQEQSSSANDSQEIHQITDAIEEPFDWLQDVLKAISKEQRISKRSASELIQDIKIALGCLHDPKLPERHHATMTSGHFMNSDDGGCITWKSPNVSSILDPSHASANNSSVRETIKQQQSSLSTSIHKIIGLVEGLKRADPMGCDSNCTGPKKEERFLSSAVSAEYFVRVFQWRSSELSYVLQQFVHSCNGLVTNETSLPDFAEDLYATLEWIMSNYVTPKDASSTREKIKRHFGWNEPQNENEVDVVGNGLLVGLKDCIVSEEKSSCLNTPDSSLQMESLLHILQEENKMLKNELQNVESARKDADVKLQSTVDKAETLTLQLKESEQTIGSLLAELENLKDSKGMIEDQIENLKSINEDVDTQLTVAKAKLNEVLQKFSSLEVELEDRTHCCEELEATCLELQLELESVGKKETLNYDTSKEQKQAQHGWEITATSLKLSECQETTLDIGKQLKALTLPMEASVLDNQVTSTRARNFTKRFSLRDQMLAEDNAKAIILSSSNEETQVSSYDHSNSGNLVLVQTPYTYLGSKRRTEDALAGALAIVPSKKLGVGLFRRLLMRRKKGTSKKSQSLTKS